MKAVILAGGKGTRMGEATREIPKPMLKIGGKPLLEHQINLLKKYRILEIVIITGHLSEVIENHFKDGSDFGVKITYYREETPLGTTGGIKEMEDQLVEDFIVLYGDIMLNMDLNKLIEFHQNKKGTATLVVHPNDHPYDSDLVKVNQNQKIVGFHSKPHEEGKHFRNLVNAAVYIFSPKILKHLKKEVKEDFGKDIFPRIFEKEALYGYNTAEYLKDIGTPDRLAQVVEAYLSGKIERSNKEIKRKAIFLDRDGVINELRDYVSKLEDFKLLPGVVEAIKKINTSEFLAIVVTNQPVIARNLCSIKDIEMIHNKMETLLGKEGVKLDAIYYCPHHPDKGHPGENPKYKVECGCRKPKIGMIKQAVNDFNIDLGGSFIIGDSFRDIECGKNAGLKTVGVKTGEGFKNSEPAHIFENLKEAVDFILK